MTRFRSNRPLGAARTIPETMNVATVPLMSMIKNYCHIHQKHFGKGFFGRGRRRCYQCERNMKTQIDMNEKEFKLPDMPEATFAVDGSVPAWCRKHIHELREGFITACRLAQQEHERAEAIDHHWGEAQAIHAKETDDLRHELQREREARAALNGDSHAE